MTISKDRNAEPREIALFSTRYFQRIAIPSCQEPQASGGYTVIEINDGGSSVLPEQMDPRELYRAVLG